MNARDLADHAADGSRRRRDDNGVARARFAEPREPGVGREPGHAEDADAQAEQVRVRRHLARRLGRHGGVVLPAAGLDARRVDLAAADDAAQERVEREVAVAHEQHARAGLGHGPGRQREVVRRRDAVREPRERDARLLGRRHPSVPA